MKKQILSTHSDLLQGLDSYDVEHSSHGQPSCFAKQKATTLLRTANDLTVAVKLREFLAQVRPVEVISLETRL